MRRLHRAALALLVWSTAASMLLGNIPHFTCRCPDGTVKSFCFGSASPESNVPNQSSCCCGGTCCGQTQDGADCSCCGGEAPVETSSCCQNAENDSRSADPGDGSAPEKSPTFSSTPCHKTLAMPDDCGLIRPEAKANLDLSGDSAFLTISTPDPILPCPACVKQDRQARCLLPATDLVTVLQRLTI